MIWVIGAVTVLAVLSAIGQAMATTMPKPATPPHAAPPASKWAAVPQGQDIALAPGFYAVVAMVKDSHPAADVKKLLLDKGLVVVDYTDPANPAGYDVKSGYRVVAAMAQVRVGGGSIPWSLPAPLSWVDSTRVLQAWKAVPA